MANSDTVHRSSDDSSAYDDCLDQQRKFREDTEGIIQTQDLLCQKLKSLISQLSADVIFDLIKELHEFKVKSDQIEQTATAVQHQLQHLINDDTQDLKGQLMAISNAFNPELNDHLENDIEHLKEDVEQLKLLFEEIKHHSRRRRQSHSQPSTRTMDSLQSTGQNCLLSLAGLPKESITPQTTAHTTLSNLLVRQISPSIIDLNENDFDISEERPEEKVIEINSSEQAPKISHKIRLSNNIVKWLRGPLKFAVDGTFYVVDLFARNTHISESVVKAVKQGAAKQNQFTSTEHPSDELFRSPFIEITPDWKYAGANDDQGYSSDSFWIKDPQNQRLLVKIQDHALCAVNEWLAYVLGKLLGLPINEVQIAIYEDKLVSLHKDVAEEDEQTLTYMDLPKKIQQIVITDPLLEGMDLFDHIIQNVDRNPRNILITIPKDTSVEEENVKLKIHLIDHSPCFGMGKLNGLSVFANKFHSQHLAVVKFDPIGQAKKFEQYLCKLPIEDRALIAKTLNRFASVTDEQIDWLITEVQDLLSTSQYNRIHSVLYRQRDIARRYIKQWGIEPRSTSIRPQKTEEEEEEEEDTRL
ncbi:unnamed protein product [Adineta ricciae]|uniref:Uncharacterized protein n=3 Tax=Adineta ricciae TaxID=249248 RepID=A0A813TY89_ADIRI|nr:unnamed protein product [Adineta ricciae]